MTKVFREALRGWIRSLKGQWAAGAFTSAEPGMTEKANFQAVAQVRLLEELLEIDSEKLEECLDAE